MSSVFLRSPDQGLVRKYKRPGEANFSRLTLQGMHTIRMHRDPMHLEWIRDSSTPHATVPPKTLKSISPDGLATGRAWLMATITPMKPHTRIDNDIIDNCASQLGIYGLGIYLGIKRHLNQKTGECYPSYATIARKLGIDRSTVIRYVKKLKTLNLLSPELRFKEDGSPTSNQYNFSPVSAPGKKGESKEGSGTEPPPLVAENNRGSGTQPPEQSSFPNKKERTIADVNLFPTGRQTTCPHPRSDIVFLADNITLCHHCYGLLDENLILIVHEENPHAEGVDTSEAA